MKKKIVIAILAIALLSVGAFVGRMTLSSAFAQDTTPTTEATPVPEVTITPIENEDDDEVAAPFGRGMHMGIEGDDTAVAEKLGKTAEEMTAARTAALEKAVADAVAAGVITQTQADGIAADGLFGWGQLVRLAGDEYASTLDQEKYFAEALGVTVEALEAARAEVRAAQLAAAVEAGTITQEQADLIAGHQALANSDSFVADVKSSLETAINNAVTAGTITQAQADALISKLATQDFGRGLFGGGMFGGRGGMKGGMMGGMMGGFQDGNRNGMLGELAEGLQNGLGKMFGGNQNGTPGGMMGGNQLGRSGGMMGGYQNGTPGGMMGGRQGGSFGGFGNGQGTGLGTCDGTCTQTNP